MKRRNGVGKARERVRNGEEKGGKGVVGGGVKNKKRRKTIRE
jgi:hypothetical protein